MSATTSTACGRTVPAGQRRRCCPAASARSPGPPTRSGGRCRPQSASNALAPGHDRVAVDDALDPEPGAVGERLDGGQRRRCRARRGRRRRWPRAIGCSDACSSGADEPQHLIGGRCPSPAITSTSSMRPVVTRAGLVEHDRVDAPRRLEHLGALDEDAELRAPAGAHEQRGGRGQTERAGAGDDQHRHRGGERGRGRLRRDGSQPTSVARAMTRTMGTNTAATRSASRCTGALPLWASVTRRAMLGELVSAPDPGGAHDQPAADVHGGADDARRPAPPRPARSRR